MNLNPNYLEDRVIRYLEVKHEKIRCCFDCLGDAFPYMVFSNVWREAVPNTSVLVKMIKDLMSDSASSRIIPSSLEICVHCLEKRLGRSLRIEDFTIAPINNPIRLGYKIATALSN